MKANSERETTKTSLVCGMTRETKINKNTEVNGVVTLSPFHVTCVATSSSESLLKELI